MGLQNYINNNNHDKDLHLNSNTDINSNSQNKFNLNVQTVMSPIRPLNNIHNTSTQFLSPNIQHHLSSNQNLSLLPPTTSNTSQNNRTDTSQTHHNNLLNLNSNSHQPGFIGQLENVN